MPTQFSQGELDLGSSGGPKLVGAFDGVAITSNGGVVVPQCRRLPQSSNDTSVIVAVRSAG